MHTYEESRRLLTVHSRQVLPYHTHRLLSERSWVQLVASQDCLPPVGGLPSPPNAPCYRGRVVNGLIVTKHGYAPPSLPGDARIYRPELHGGPHSRRGFREQAGLVVLLTHRVRLAVIQPDVIQRRRRQGRGGRRRRGVGKSVIV